MYKTRWMRWELCLLTALCITFTAGMLAQKDQASLSEKLIRPHVVANSDSDGDQAEKLLIRDRALALLAPALTVCRTREEAEEVIRSHRTELEALGDVTMTLSEEFYPTRHYDSFSLPAGEYLSLRLTVGEGQGHNWWCVVFPPLCTEALAEESRDAFSSLTDEETALITGEEPAYELRFRVVELWGRLEELFG